MFFTTRFYVTEIVNYCLCLQMLVKVQRWIILMCDVEITRREVSSLLCVDISRNFVSDKCQ